MGDLRNYDQSSLGVSDLNMRGSGADSHVFSEIRAVLRQQLIYMPKTSYRPN